VNEALNQATQNLKEGKLDRAMREFQVIVETDPLNTIAYFTTVHFFWGLTHGILHSTFQAQE